MPAGQQAAFEKSLGAEMVQGYGLTECLPVICNPPGSRNRHGTLGVPGRRDIHIRIMGEAGQELPPGRIGEIQIRSTTTMVGYHRLPEDTLKIFDGDWLRTGDVGHLDEEGYLHFRGMTKPILNLNGNKVDPLEVRDAILEHPAVATATVSALPGLPGSRGNGHMRLCARVVPKQNKSLSHAELREFCVARLASYKVPQTIVVEACAEATTAGQSLAN